MDAVRNVIVVPDDDPRSSRALMDAALLAAAGRPVTVTVLASDPDLRALEELDTAGLDIEVRSASKWPDRDLGDIVQDERCDLVVVGDGHFGRRAARRRLVRQVSAPIWVVPSVRPLGSDVAVAVGPFPDQATASDALHGLVVETGAELARRRSGRLHIVHAWALAGESFMRSSRLALSRQEIADLKDEAVWCARRRLNNLLRSCRLDGVRWQITMEEGSVDQALSRVARASYVHDVVVGSAGRTGVIGLAIGNTAERLDTLGKSLLIVPKPAAMATPVFV